MAKVHNHGYSQAIMWFYVDKPIKYNTYFIMKYGFIRWVVQKYEGEWQRMVLGSRVVSLQNGLGTLKREWVLLLSVMPMPRREGWRLGVAAAEEGLVGDECRKRGLLLGTLRRVSGRLGMVGACVIVRVGAHLDVKQHI
ncbi:hypothetical protein PIB30_082898 [Stylosanthes scabra]|uniref:Uncharacterized protein n=1 Tax=Stylosanthes scabra TaxID=79078 RepID=A0ABU6XT67_9FABA|nr:hypothetical protein [Stylosanthes scabra]